MGVRGTGIRLGSEGFIACASLVFALNHCLIYEKGIQMLFVSVTMFYFVMFCGTCYACVLKYYAIVLFTFDLKLPNILYNR